MTDITDLKRRLNAVELQIRTILDRIEMADKKLEGNRHLDDARYAELEQRLNDVEKRL